MQEDDLRLRNRSMNSLNVEACSDWMYCSTAYDTEFIKSFKKSEQELNSLRSRTLADFYREQNQTIEALESIDVPLLGDDAEKKKNESNIEEKLIIQGTILLNSLLVLVNMFGAYKTHSVSILAMAMDSILDVLACSVFFVISRLQWRYSPYSYPIGRGRLEPIGIIVFSTLMFSISIQLMIEAVKKFIYKERSIEFNIYTLSFLGGGILIKFFMFLYCRYIARQTSNVKVLARDHLNDVIANSSALAFGTLGKYWIWELDPVGCFCISTYLMYTWVREGAKTIQMLAGYRANNQLMKKWTYICLKHHPRIKQIDTVRAYHLSLGFIVEVDIVLPSDMTVEEAHDIGETLQIKLESLKEVERAFVHIDYSSDHKPEH